jgi:hypothetical protein
MTNDFDLVESIYSGWLARLADLQGIGSLSIPQKTVLLTWWAKGEIDNGGFALLYCSPMDIDEIACTFLELGMIDAANACRNSKSVFPEGKPPVDQTDRMALVESILNSAGKDDPWEPFNKVIWGLNKDFDRIVAEYVKNNVDHFIHPESTR